MRSRPEHHGYVDADSDTQRIDDIEYLQAKLLLKPTELTSLDQFRDFGRQVKHIARASRVDHIGSAATHEPPRVREVVFIDTPDFALYSKNFILRRRIPFVDGFPAGEPEIVFKCRAPELERAAAHDLRPRIAGKYRIKFKLQTLPPRDHLGGYRLLYSRSCQFGVSQVREKDRTAMDTLARVFRPLTDIKKKGGEHVRLVNEGIVEELLLPLGKLDFGKGIRGKSSVALWRTRGDHRPLIGEYSFQVKVDGHDGMPKEAERRFKSFFLLLQEELRKSIAVGTTKTSLVYGLSTNRRKNQE